MSGSADTQVSQPHAEKSARPRTPRLNWTDHDLFIILAARLSMSAARAVAGVITALYLADQGFSATEIGLLFLAVAIGSAVMSSAVGLLSDRYARKPFLVGVPLLAAGAALGFALSRTTAVLYLCAALGSFGRGMGAGGGTVGPYQPAETAFVAEYVGQKMRATAFGRLAFVSSLGAVLGGLLAGLAPTTRSLSPAAAVSAYRPAFLAAAALALIAGLVALGLHETRTGPVRDGSLRRPFNWPRRSFPALWRFWITNSVNGFAIGMAGPFLSYWFYRRYDVSPATIGLVFAAVNAGTIVSTLLAASIARRLGLLRSIIVGRAVSGLLFVPMVLAPALWMAAAIFFVRMLVQRVAMPLRQSFSQDLADPAERASLAALSNLPAQAAMAGSQVFAGYLFDEISLSLPFELAGALQCVTAGLYAFLFGRGRFSLANTGDVRENGGPGPHND